MNNLGLLIKKQFLDLVPANVSRKKGKVSFDFFAFLLIGLLIGALMFLAIYILKQFTVSYSEIKINRVLNIQAREYELISLFYFVYFIILIVLSCASLERQLFEVGDYKILSYMPFSATEIYWSKTFFLYIKELVLTMLLFFTINFTIFATNGTLSVYRGIMTALVSFVFPLLPIGIGTLLVIPLLKLKNVLKANPIIASILILAALAVFCIAYAFLFRGIEQVLLSGKITSLFNETTMTGIVKFTTFAYPVMSYSKIIMAEKLYIHIPVIVIASILFIVADFFLMKNVLTRSIQNKINAKKSIFRQSIRFGRKSVFGSLFTKEAYMSFSSPNYAFMCFSTLIITPIISYFSATVALDVVQKVLGSLPINFEICAVMCILFASITNTYSSTNISRDGSMAVISKTMPFNPRMILFVKLLFCSIICELSILITTILFVSLSFISVVDGVVLFIATSLLCLAQTLIGTRLDLNKPRFPKMDDGEVKESNNTVSIILVIGLLATIIIAALVMLIILTAKTINITYIYLITLGIPFVFLIIAFLVYELGLTKTYKKMDMEV